MQVSTNIGASNGILDLARLSGVVHNERGPAIIDFQGVGYI